MSMQRTQRPIAKLSKYGASNYQADLVLNFKSKNKKSKQHSLIKFVTGTPSQKPFSKSNR